MTDGKATSADPYANEPFGKLRGEQVQVTADDGTPLYVEVEEAPEAPTGSPTVIFCHGYSINQDSYHFQRRDHRGKVRMVFWDQRCHGRSGRGPTENSVIDQLGSDLAAVIKATTPDGPIVLVGHSMGGMTILAFAANNPDVIADRVQGVLLLGTSAGGFNTVTFGLPQGAATAAHARVTEVAALLSKQAALIQRLRGPDVNRVSAEFTRVTQLGPLAPMSIAYFLDEMMNGTPVEVMLEFLPTMETYDHRDAFPHLANTRVIVLTGDRDTVLPVSHGQEIAAGIPGAEFGTLPGVGHLSMLEMPMTVNNKLNSLITN